MDAVDSGGNARGANFSTLRRDGLSAQPRGNASRADSARPRGGLALADGVAALEIASRNEPRTLAWLGTRILRVEFPLEKADLTKAQRVARALRSFFPSHDTPQTETNLSTTLRMLLNDLPVTSDARNHPHERARDLIICAETGRIRYLAHASVEDALLAQLVPTADDAFCACGVPSAKASPGRLTIYGAECGRYPICPKVIIEW